ncbi:glycoside hydrolase family 27 protein [Paenibacillus sp. PL2-23]|uniref:glycoside hydrolase family 27 protein n=1 Tax=Paenibacillus sp. PL2-23 TaxID=2100729 RepID=UPI0030F6EE11
MSHLSIATTPPMGWNSWDCYGASVTEEEVLGNAQYMADHMLEFGWEYVVVDIQWYEPGANSSIYRPFVPLVMDEYSRLVPATNRFPSAAGGRGFKPLSDRIHGMGLKFGIHIMRGIPRQAVHNDSPILGTSVTASQIASKNSICQWNTDMYGIDADKEGAQAYYDSLFQLYASWGVDFVKVDDISFPYSAGEIELIRRAIDRCGRPMVLSLSCGPAPLEMAEHLKANANMWRMTADYWDRWEDLFDEFDKCNQWSAHVGEGHWPDADMLPLGHLAIRSYEHGIGDRWTRFTHEEQMTMMTLWSIFRSPLMVGGELRDNDEWTLSLLTNPEVLRLVTHSSGGRQLFRRGDAVAWTATDVDGSTYLALFNTGVTPLNMEVALDLMKLSGTYQLRDLWALEDLGAAESRVAAEVLPHGARLFKLSV